MYVGMNYINGGWAPHRPDFQSLNPSTEAEIGLFPETQGVEITEAIQYAKQAFPKWRDLSRVKRAEYFDRLCGLIKENSDRLVNAISLETGKTKNESLAEVNEALHMAQYTFGMGRMQCGNMVSSEISEKDSYVIRKPKGVVAVISPWNFPLAIGAFWCVAPALLEGNTVVFKPSEDSPMVAQIAVELYDKAEFPEGVINLIHGRGGTGRILAAHKDVNHICFTGSAEVGQQIKKACADTWNKSCSCEMGSKSAVIVCSDADLDMAADACVASAIKLSGQRCVSAGRIIIEHSVYDAFTKKFFERIGKQKPGDPFEDADATYGPLISQQQFNRVVEYNRQATEDQHTTVLMPASRVARKGWYVTPHVYTTKWQKDEKRPFLKQEVFGPHIALLPFDDLQEAIDIYNNTDFALAMGVMTNDFRKARKVRQEAIYGIGYWNGGTIAAESHLPFTGLKRSGYGHGSAAGTFDAVVDKVTWTVNHAGGLEFPQGLE